MVRISARTIASAVSGSSLRKLVPKLYLPRVDTLPKMSHVAISGDCEYGDANHRVHGSTLGSEEHVGVTEIGHLGVGQHVSVVRERLLDEHRER